eukprot:m.130737 g.130737  ORF g.130737 m.130737 type:complete len:55 (+) comp15728_c0_seq5:865-1029(+)
MEGRGSEEKVQEEMRSTEAKANRREEEEQRNGVNDESTDGELTDKDQQMENQQM